MGRKLRKLRKGEHRYLTVTEKLRIARPKNFKKWKEKREVSKKVWIYKEEILQKEKIRYKEIITKRKETIRLKKESHEKAIKHLEKMGVEFEDDTFAEIQKKERRELKARLMWRITVGLSYSYGEGSFNVYKSYKIQLWAKTKQELLFKQEDIKNKVIDYVNAQLKKKNLCLADCYWLNTIEPHTSIQQVPLDNSLIGFEEEKDEVVARGPKRGGRQVIPQNWKNKPASFDEPKLSDFRGWKTK